MLWTFQVPLDRNILVKGRMKDGKGEDYKKVEFGTAAESETC